MRKTFKDILIDLALNDEDVVFLTGDLGFEFNAFKDKFPNRYFNMGVCEQTMIGAAAGMAIEGLKPVAYSITPFLLERPFEQIKIDLDQQNLKVMLVGYADYPDMGPTHAELDWETITGMLNNVKGFFPKTEEQAASSLREAYEYSGPSIVSLKKAPKENVSAVNSKLDLQQETSQVGSFSQNGTSTGKDYLSRMR
jgi:transketolase